MTGGVASIVVSLVLVAPPTPDRSQATPVRVELKPMRDPDLERVADFLEPRLRVLAEGQGDGELLLEIERLDQARAAFRLRRGEALLTERVQERGTDGFDALELWLAMKNAWARSTEALPGATGAPPDPRWPGPSRRDPTHSPPFERPVTVSANALLQGDGLSAFGAALGIGRADSDLSVAGELAYHRAPVDDALTVHHIFVQAHLGYRAVDGFALEGTARLSALLAVAGAQDATALDLGLGASGHVWFGPESDLWLRATVLTHPVTQRYLLDGGERETSSLTFNLAVGVGL